MKLLLFTFALLGGAGSAVIAQPANGIYNGLFFEPDQISQQSSGSFTLTLRTGGAFSGKLQLGNARVSISGQFDNTGKASLTVYPKNSSPLNLDLDGSQETNRIVGFVSDGNWTATLAANRTVFDGKSVTSLEAGKYTLVVSGKDGSTTEPRGDGFGTVTVDIAGRIKLAGCLADGTKVSQSSVLSMNGDWPLYISMDGGKGSVLSWVTFANLPGSDLIGDLRWIKPANSKTKLHAQGFTNQTTVVGSSYFPPPSGTTILNITSGAVTLDGGNLSQNISNNVILDANNRLRNLGTNPLALTFALPSGAFRGTVRQPGTLRSIPFNGVVLQKGNIASGYFAGTNQSGAVRLSSITQDVVEFQTIGSSFAPEVQLSGTPESFLWSWSDATTSTNYPSASKNFGSASARLQYLSIVPGESLRSINLGFDGSDGGEDVPITLRPQQNVSAVHFSAPLVGLQYWASSHNPITNGLDFTGFASLVDIECFHCINLKHVTVANLSLLKRICVEDCGLQELDLTADPALEDLRAALNVFTNVVVADGTGPNIWHWCTRNNPNITQDFQTLMTNFYSLRELLIWDNNQHGALSPVSSNLTEVKANDNHYTSADFNGQIHLQTCWLQNNSLTNLVLTDCIGLKDLDAHNNQLTTAELDQLLLDLVATPNLQSVNLTNNTGRASLFIDNPVYDAYLTLLSRGVSVQLDSP